MGDMEQAQAALRPAASSGLVEHARVELREAIVSGQLRPGDRLIEQDLARQLQLSRGPVRQALRELSYEGLVTLRPNRGAVVASVSAEDVLEVYAMRAALGSMALRHLIGAGRSSQTVDHLRTVAVRAKMVSNRSRQDRLVKCDLAFQAAIVEASGLRRVAAKFRELSVEIQLFITALEIRYPDVQQILDEHDALVDAIADGDAGRADHIWRTRFRRAVDEFLVAIPDSHAVAVQRPWLLSALEDEPATGPSSTD